MVVRVAYLDRLLVWNTEVMVRLSALGNIKKRVARIRLRTGDVDGTANRCKYEWKEKRWQEYKSGFVTL